MSEPRIGRVLVASLHQAIMDILPDRLEFYENWLTTTGLREGTIGLGPLSAVLSFLRSEGRAYNLTVTRAGEHAADWTVAGMSGLRRGIIRALPRPLRLVAALRIASGLVTATYPGSRAITRVRPGSVSVELRGSLFCEVRGMTMLPLCGFYAAAIERVLENLSVRSDVHVHECRAAGGDRGCVLAVALQGAPAAAAGPARG